MIHRIRHSDYLKLFWGLMAAFLLNLSVDAPDPFPQHVPEDLTHNEQESITEWVVEKVLGYENAFVEYDDDDGDERSSELTVKLAATLLAALPFSLRPPAEYRAVPAYPPYTRWLTPGHHEVTGPPPRA